MTFAEAVLRVRLGRPPGHSELVGAVEGRVDEFIRAISGETSEAGVTLGDACPECGGEIGVSSTKRDGDLVTRWLWCRQCCRQFGNVLVDSQFVPRRGS